MLQKREVCLIEIADAFQGHHHFRAGAAIGFADDKCRVKVFFFQL